MLVFRNDFPLNIAVLMASFFLSGILLGSLLVAISFSLSDNIDNQDSHQVVNLVPFTKLFLQKAITIFS